MPPGTDDQNVLLALSDPHGHRPRSAPGDESLQGKARHAGAEHLCERGDQLLPRPALPMIGTEEFPASAAGYRDLLGWARASGMVRRAGVEGSGPEWKGPVPSGPSCPVICWPRVWTFSM
ncbi:hypothetical protein GCM10010508_38430 [Streptomyces naganishii JCM 4654]|uniref:Uncharacterized protein n=1 Tax=Streptomyces naganishii JCM 4654 TaxID=1306179 RepID=A0A918Y5P9_9ACTN|nr:hypothetical protein GCM10010508_38430 [Streptomyces naganishii JCM 4654]